MKKQVLFFAAIIFALTVYGQKLPFQGKLIETGVPVSGTRTLEFSIAEPAWSETHTDVSITDGLYFVVLGSINPLPDYLFFTNDEISLSISVDGTSLSPVILFKPFSTPYAGTWIGLKGAIDTISYGPNGWFAKKGGTQTGQFQSQDWGGIGAAGRLLLNGPTTQNFEMTSQHWVNADLPMMRLWGSSNQVAAIISAETDENESGTISLNTKRDENQIYRELTLNSTSLSIREKQNWNVLHEAISLNAENRDDLGWAGYFNLAGPNSSNIQLGTRHWEGTPDLPLINLHGEGDFHGMELSITRDNENNQFGWINLMSENGKSLHLSPNGLGVEGIEMSTSTFEGQNFGSLRIAGSNTTNFEFNPGWWNQPDRAIFNMNGETDQNRITLVIENNDFGDEAGRIFTRSDNAQGIYEPTKMLLVDTEGGVWNHMASLNINDDPVNGKFGGAVFNGPNSQNVVIMPDWWDKPDKGFLQVNGTGAGRVELESQDNGGGEFGLIHLYSDYQKSIRMEPTSFALRDDANGYNHLISMSTNNDNGSWVGTLDINGPTSSNVHIGSQGNPDLPWMTLSATGHEAVQIGCYESPWEEGFITVRANNNDFMKFDATGISGSSPIEIQNGANVTNNLNVNGNITAISVTETSDKRFKKNIQKVENSLEKVELIEGVSYNWRQDEFPEKNFSSDKQIGVIAQDLEAQFPALVKTDEEGYKSVNYNGFTAVLLEAVKELNAKVENLETENMQLKAELSASTSNKTEIEQLRMQVDELSKMVQREQTPVATEEIISTPGLK